MGNRKSIAIVGGGVAGITTAYFLAKKYKVRLFDPNGIAEQCSYATVSYTHLTLPTTR